MMYRLVDALISLVVTCAFGAMVWFTGTMLVGNIMFLMTGLNLSLIVYTWSIAVICMVLALACIAGIISTIATLTGRFRFDF